jgi:hypothetical protein
MSRSLVERICQMIIADQADDLRPYVPTQMRADQEVL